MVVRFECFVSGIPPHCLFRAPRGGARRNDSRQKLFHCLECNIRVSKTSFHHFDGLWVVVHQEEAAS